VSFRIDQDTSMLAQDDTQLYSLATRGGPIEAPAIVYRRGSYYLFVSFDFCCRGINSSYRIKAGRTTNMIGRYVDKAGNPMAKGGGDTILAGQGRFVGPGRQSVYLDDGIYRLVHHYYDASDNGVAKLRIRDLAWTNDGWPLVEQG